MFGNFAAIFYWWLLLFGLGTAFTPLTFKLFPKFFDKGYAFSKIIGILIVSYVVWLLGSLKILQFVPEAVWLVVLAGVGANLKGIKGIKGVKGLKDIWRIILFEEILFFVCLAAWSVIRGFQPDIHGAEKFMDFSLLNSILRSRYFPPKDVWFAGKTINYYYFGHLVSAVLTKLSGLDSAVTYNLMIATVFALTFTAAFSLGGNIINKNPKFEALNPKQYQNSKSKFSKRFEFLSFGDLNLFRISDLGFRILAGGLLSAFLLTLAGNLHPLYWFLKNHNLKNYWYYDAIRFIGEQFGAADNTINEFPSFSFIFADLHGHLLNIPTALLILALLLHFKPKIPQFLILALCFATTFMTNAWDFPIYLLLSGLLFWRRRGWKYSAALCCLLITVSGLLSLPFHLNFRNISQGIGLTDFHSPPWMLLVLWGFPLFLTVGWFVFQKYVVATSYVAVLLTVTWLLILVPEVIYIKDIYIHSYQRANTMFKLTYQSFIMFSLAGGYIIVKTLSNLKKTIFHLLYAVVLFILLIFVFIYPFYAVRSYYGLKEYKGLEGLKWLEQQYPNDFEAINWLRANIQGQPVVLEAAGESYTDFARVSANTGLPTVCGWTVHEWLWRGSYDEPGKRLEEVREIYESDDLDKVNSLLTKYQVEYIFVGSLEKQKYAGLEEGKFAKMGKVVFENKEAKIYHLTQVL